LSTSPQFAQARLRDIKKKKAEEDARAKAEQQVRGSSGGSGSGSRDVTRVFSGNCEELSALG
jgi:hypothetical protein